MNENSIYKSIIETFNYDSLQSPHEYMKYFITHLDNNIYR